MNNITIEHLKKTLRNPKHYGVGCEDKAYKYFDNLKEALEYANTRPYNVMLYRAKAITPGELLGEMQDFVDMINDTYAWDFSGQRREDEKPLRIRKEMHEELRSAIGDAILAFLKEKKIPWNCYDTPSGIGLTCTMIEKLLKELESNE